MGRYLIPLAAFAVLVVFLAIGLRLDPREVPSPLIDKPAPAFTRARLHTPAKPFSPADMKGKVWLLNVWASWCVACREEHPILLDLSRTGVIPIVGLNYKDKDPDAKAWLAQFGDPYTLSAVDPDGSVGIDYGVYGVPETFLIDKTGVIRYKQIGPVTPDNLAKKILPMAQSLEKQ